MTLEQVIEKSVAYDCMCSFPKEIRDEAVKKLASAICSYIVGECEKLLKAYEPFPAPKDYRHALADLMKVLEV